MLDFDESESKNVIRVALSLPLLTTFDYLLSDDINMIDCQIGARVEVPFGKKQVIGIIVDKDIKTIIPLEKMRIINQLLDRSSLFTDEMMTLCRWVSDYYHYSLGSTLCLSIPKLLRKGHKAQLDGLLHWRLKESLELDEISLQLKKSPKQLQLFNFLITQQYQRAQEKKLLDLGFSKAIIKTLVNKGLLIKQRVQKAITNIDSSQEILKESPLRLTTEQEHAVNTVLDNQSVTLLQGVTGSGKTEVYFHIITTILKKGQQALVLVPEIGLTTQILSRFHQRFNVPIVCVHSNLSEKERLNSWLLAHEGHAKIVIATRSGVFTSMLNLGVIIVDEEHDASYKQQESFCYHARDVAIYRAKLHRCPVLLGSATPSLESIYNTKVGRYQLAYMKQRAFGTTLPKIDLVDLRYQTVKNGLSDFALDSIAQTLNRKKQVLVFLNRRGFSSSMLCYDCGFLLDCPNCDVPLTMHYQPSQLLCHYCEYTSSIPFYCPSCQGKRFYPTGQGTEQCEMVLARRFPETSLVRIDRDSTKHKGSLEKLLNQVNDDEAGILLGTQMLAKGHHFSNIELVVVVNADQGLFSADFRSTEKMGQMILQVAGRCGRGLQVGHVLLQTYNPNSSMIQQLTHHDYSSLCLDWLNERRQLSLPPFSYLLLVKAESVISLEAQEVLRKIKNLLDDKKNMIMFSMIGPLPANIERRQKRYRHQLIIKANKRSTVHCIFHEIQQYLSKLKISKSIRLIFDIDPQEIL